MTTTIEVKDLALGDQRTLVTIQGVRPERPTPRDLAIGILRFTEEERKALAEVVRAMDEPDKQIWFRFLGHYLFGNSGTV